MVRYNLSELMKKMTEAELAKMDHMLMDVGNYGSSPRSSWKLSEWMSQTASNHGIEGSVTPRRRRSLSL